ncbi:MAG: hypothetical protein LKH33_07610 [Acetobacter sp.]|jgi:hypothetical protein|nr:hypothetical protein [Acetobacter sp.]MCH4061462.1 hypothetical protein [Acetobacter sp.]MCI1294094.1 hypothetical protein [Acetobacter sp.]MCI1320687.1 hypothetical protein [Acetobacter sp.]MCI1373987.1 hypothetical protein [Acetobacter sp.]
MSIVYEGKELVIHHNVGDTDYLLITFTGVSDYKTAISTFFAQKIVEKYNINCLGITSKVNFWYISEEKNKILEEMKKISYKFKNIIMIGISMGGYAALAWSKELKATSILSMSPKYSLDPDECDIHRHYVIHHFREQMKGMSIKQNMVSGRIFLAYDPYFEHDAYHAYLIKTELQKSKLFFSKTFYSGHVVSLSLAGSKEFFSIIEALAFGKDSDVIKILSETRRNNLFNIKERLKLYIEKKPKLVFKSLFSQGVLQNEKNKKIFLDFSFMMKLSYHLSKHKFFSEMQKVYSMACIYYILKNRVKESFLEYCEGNPREFSLVSCHGYILSYNFEENKLIFSNNFKNNDYFVKFDHSTRYLYLLFRGIKFFILEKDEDISLSQIPTVDTLIVNDNFHEETYSQSVRTSKGWLVSLPDGRCGLGSPRCQEWEKFSIVAEGKESVLYIQREIEILNSSSGYWSHFNRNDVVGKCALSFLTLNNKHIFLLGCKSIKKFMLDIKKIFLNIERYDLNNKMILTPHKLQKFYVYSYHGGMLLYNPKTSHIVHGKEIQDGLYPIQFLYFEKPHSYGVFSINSKDCCLDSDNRTFISQTYKIVKNKENNFVNFQHSRNNLYISALPLEKDLKNIEADRCISDLWENFTLKEINDTSDFVFYTPENLNNAYKVIQWICASETLPSCIEFAIVFEEMSDIERERLSSFAPGLLWPIL